MKKWSKKTFVFPSFYDAELISAHLGELLQILLRGGFRFKWSSRSVLFANVFIKSPWLETVLAPGSDDQKAFTNTLHWIRYASFFDSPVFRSTDFLFGWSECTLVTCLRRFEPSEKYFLQISHWWQTWQKARAVCFVSKMFVNYFRSVVFITCECLAAHERARAHRAPEITSVGARVGKRSLALGALVYCCCNLHFSFFG